MRSLQFLLRINLLFNLLLNLNRPQETAFCWFWRLQTVILILRFVSHLKIVQGLWQIISAESVFNNILKCSLRLLSFQTIGVIFLNRGMILDSIEMIINCGFFLQKLGFESTSLYLLNELGSFFIFWYICITLTRNFIIFNFKDTILFLLNLLKLVFSD